MLKLIPLIALLGGFLFLSCEKDGLSYFERRVVGNWEYSKVKYVKNWSLKTHDISAEFEPFNLRLADDYSANYSNDATGEVYSGIWEISEVCTDESTVQTLFASFTNDETGEIMQLVFEDITVSKHVFRATYNGHDGHFRYVLEKE